MAGYANGTKKLGQLLVERGWITGEQLIRAIQSQRMVGGRIGTCLLEMDVLTEERLLDALSEQLRVPAAGIDMLRGIDDGTLELVPAKVAHRCRAVPFFSNRDQVKVATLEVHNLSHLDELKFCTNKKVVPHIANEVRIFEALEKHYGVELPRRYGHLLDRLNRSRYLWDESAKVLFGVEEGGMVWTNPEDVFEIPGLITAANSRRPTPAAISTAPARPVESAIVETPQPAAPQPAAPQPAAPQTATPQTATPQPAAPQPATPVLDLNFADQLFGQAESQHQIAEVLLGYARQIFDRAAIFKVMPKQIGGWKCSASDIDAEKFAKLSISSEAPSIFFDLKKGEPFHLGAMPPIPAHQAIAETWGGRLPKEAFLMPISVRGRMVCVLYGDRRDAGVQDVEITSFQRLADKAAMAFELFILRRKISTIQA